MSPLSPADAAHLPLETDADIERRVIDLIGPACRRQVWVLFLDERDVQLPVIMPVEDYPEPDDSRFAEFVTSRLADLAREVGAARVVLVWERPGGSGIQPAERFWARTMLDVAGLSGPFVRAQLVAHSRGVRWLAPDDLLGA